MRFRLLLVIFMVFAISITHAQDNIITYGDSMDGEITNREFEIEYSFEGKTGDIIVIKLKPEDPFEGLGQPALILLDGDFEVLQTVTGSYDTATLVYELTNDGTHYILATREDGRSGESQGIYTLLLDLLQPLSIGDTQQAEVTNENLMYFAITLTEGYDLVYRRGEGDFYPEITLNIIEEDTFSSDNLTEIAVLGGDQLERGTLGIQTSSETDTIIIKIAPPDFYFTLSEESTTFTIELKSNE